MSTTLVYTAVDVVDHLVEVMGSGGTTDAQTLRRAKRSLEIAYRDFPHIRGWSYYHVIGSLKVDAYYNTGTIAYDHTGGSSERLVTLTTGTWPTWAKYGFIRIDQVNYEVESLVDSTKITLSVNNNPGADITAGESYELFRDTYPMPVDFSSMGMIRDPVNSWYPDYLSPNEFMALRCSQEGANAPRNYTLISDQNYFGTTAIRFYPPPDDDYSYEYLYRRRPRQLACYLYDTGTVSASGTTVTGTGTTFTREMIGCAIRPGTTSSAPTGYAGTNPYTEQRIITGFTSTTSIEVDQAFSNTVSGSKYQISDAIDIEGGAMYTAFLKRCEYEMAMLMKRDDVERFAATRRDTELLAAEADSKTFDRGGTAYRRRVPLRFTVENG